MTQSNEHTIEKKNQAIAEFIGWEFKQEGEDWYMAYHEGRAMWADNKKGLNKILLKGFKFHEDWNKLMLVVEKIHTLKKHNSDGKDLCLMSKLTIDIEMNGYYRKCRCSILGHITHCYTLSIPHTYETVELPSIFVHDKASLIEAVYIAVYQFIQWFNQQKQTND